MELGGEEVLINDFSVRFLSALASFGIGNEAETSGLPDQSTLEFVNCGYYAGDLGEGAAGLNGTTYTSVFSSCYPYVPSNGGIVMMGSYWLEDFEHYGEATPRAMMRITADDEVIFEGEITEFFPEEVVKEVRAFTYKKSFNIEAMRLNLSDNMSITLSQTMIIGYK